MLSATHSELEKVWNKIKKGTWKRLSSEI